MPFELKLTPFEKLKVAILTFIYSIINKEKDFDFQNFNNWANRLGIILPLAFQAKSARIEVVNAKWMIKNNENRVAKVERIHNDKYKIDRHQKNYKIDTSDFKSHIEFLISKRYTRLYIKYTVESKEIGSQNYKSENFTLFISIPFSVIFPKSFLFLITSFGFSGTNSGQ